MRSRVASFSSIHRSLIDFQRKNFVLEGWMFSFCRCLRVFLSLPLEGSYGGPQTKLIHRSIEFLCDAVVRTTSEAVVFDLVASVLLRQSRHFTLRALRLLVPQLGRLLRSTQEHIVYGTAVVLSVLVRLYGSTVRRAVLTGRYSRPLTFKTNSSSTDLSDREQFSFPIYLCLFIV
jgi:hypothetical protein